MAGDWIKMRVWLSRDPKVIWMADFLAGERAFMRWLTDPVQQSCKQSAYEHVTSNVTRALCVTALLEIWGTAREQGERIGDDLRVTKCNASILDEVAGLPLIGRAMIEVGWAVENEDDSLTFPKFFKQKDSPSVRHKSSNAERQARYRERKRNARCVTGDVTSNAQHSCNTPVTVTPLEKSREEKRNTPLTPKCERNAPLPESLNTPAFREAWERWKQYRRELHKPLKPSTEKAQLKRFAKMGLAVSIASINQSIEQGWQGLFAPKEDAVEPSSKPVETDEERRRRIARENAAAAAAEREREKQAGLFNDTEGS